MTELQAITQFLQLGASFAGSIKHHNWNSFILTHGISCCIDAESFVGGEPKQCYRNATLAALDGEGIYTEGYMTILGGLPIQHAWITTPACFVRDVTISDPSDAKVGAYFGVRFSTKYLRAAIRRTQKYGLLDFWNRGLLSEDREVWGSLP